MPGLFRCVLLSLLAAGVVGFPAASRAALLIDGFDGSQQAEGGLTSHLLANVLGGERDVHSGFPNSTARVENGQFIVEAAEGDIEVEGWLIYDGIDDSPVRDVDGLGGVDLTAGGTLDAFAIRLDSASAEFNIRIWIYSATDLRIYQSPSIDPSELVAPVDLIFPFADFPPGTPLTEAGLILVNFENDSRTTGLELAVSSIKLIPEPSTVLLTGVGLLWLGRCSRRSGRRLIF